MARKSMRWWPLAVPLALLAVLLAAPVLGHATLQSSSPMQGAHLERAPDRVSVTLTEPVDVGGSSLHVLDSDRRRVDLGDQVVTAGGNPTISVGLPANLPEGAYRMVWTALSRTDGHTTSGSVGFAIGSHEAPAGTSDPELSVQSALARFLAYAGFSLAFGAAGFLLWMSPVGYPASTARMALLVGATLHAAGTVLFLAHTASGAGLALGEVGRTGVGQVLLLRTALAAAAWVLALLWTIRPVQAGPSVVTLLLLGSALGSARLGHAFTHGYAATALDLLHLVAAATWVGGLALLLFYIWQAGRGPVTMDELRALGIRFGTLAMVAVTVLVATGLITSFAILGRSLLADPLHTLASPYGGLLMAKVLLAGVMVAIAAVNRFILLAPLDGSGAGRGETWRRRLGGGALAPGRLRRLIVAETAVGIVVLLLAGFLTSVSPPAVAQDTDVLVVGGQGLHHRVEAEMPPPRVGETAIIHLTIATLEGTPVVENTCGRTSCVTLELRFGDQPAETFRAYPAGGIWMVHDAVWTQPGQVQATVVISTEEHFQDDVAFAFAVAA